MKGEHTHLQSRVALYPSPPTRIPSLCKCPTSAGLSLIPEGAARAAIFLFLTVREVRNNKISGWGAQNRAWALRCFRELIHRCTDTTAVPVLCMSKQTGGDSCSEGLMAGKE